MNKHMISLFDGKLEEDENKHRDLYRSRLKELAEQPAMQAEPVVEDGKTTASFVAPLMMAAEPKAARPFPQPMPMSEDTGVKASGRQFRGLADNISEHFVEALAMALKELRQKEADEQSKLEDSLALIANVSEALERLRGDLSSMREETSSLSQSERTLSLKVATIDARLRDQQDNRQQTTEKFQNFEKRLDTQAAAIRALHSAVNEWGARQEELHGLLQRLGGMSGPKSGSKTLPSDL